MSKFLLIGSVAAMLYGDCVFAMDDIDPWRSASSSESQDQQNSESTSFNSPRQSRSNSQISLKSEVSAPTRDTKSENMIKDQNRFIKTVFRDYTGRIIQSCYHQYHYNSLDNALVGQATPTTIETITREDLRSWSDISEIRYANDVSYDKLENPKAILYRNMDKSCYIILRIKDTKYDVFYGLNERNIEVGRQSFAVYEVSEDVGSFTDGVERLIYVDESGLYFVPKAENSVKDVIKTYQAEGKFNFKGSVIKVSAIDGSITWNGEPITENNFFDNWIQKEVENRAPVSGPVFGGRNAKQMKTELSTEQPKTNEILRNFYPPEGRYVRIHGANYEYATDTTPGGHQIHTALDWLNAYGIPNKIGTSSWGRQSIIDLRDRNWFSTFISNRIRLAKARSKNGAEELVKNGTFSSILSIYTDRRYDHDSYLDNANGYPQKVRDAIADRVAAKRGQTMSSVKATFSDKRVDQPSSISDLVSKNSDLFKDPEFVKSLKPAFKELEKDYEHNKESELWLPFEIVRNL